MADVSRAAAWVWTCDLDWAGRRFRLSERALSVPDVTGAAIEYVPGLTRVGYESRLDLLETDPAVAEVPITVDLGPDFLTLLGDGHEVRLAYARLRLVPLALDGSALGDYADGIEVAAGTLRAIQYGDPDAPTLLQATVGDEPGRSTGPLLPPSATITQETWSTAADAADGKPMPLVFGQPGHYPRGADTVRTPGSPCYVITSSGGGGTASLGLIAAHAVNAATVDIYNRTQDKWLTGMPVTTTADLSERYRQIYEMHAEVAQQNQAVQDLFNNATISSALGLQIGFNDVGEQLGLWGYPGAFDLPRSLLAVVDFTPLGVGDTPQTNDELWVAWVDGPALEDEQGQPIVTAGQLLLWLLRRSGLPFDLGRTVPVAELLTHTVSGYVNDPDVSAWDYLQDVLLPMLPVTLARGPLGIYPVLLRSEAPAADVLFRWTAGEDVVPESPAQCEDATGPAALRVAWGWDPVREAYRGEARVGLETDPATLRVSTAQARTRATRYAGSGVLDLEAAIVGDLATAQRVGSEQLGIRSWPLTTRTYSAPPGVVVDLGDEGAITDAAVGWSSRRALVLGREWAGDRWLYRLAVREGARP